jgi:hypothetical protein
MSGRPETESLRLCARAWTAFATRTTIIGLLVIFLSSDAYSQFGRGFRVPPRFPTTDSFDGAFNFCRLMYSSVRREAGGQGWMTDYPDADINLSIRLGELTKTRVSFDASGRPNHFVVRPTDPALLECPWVLASDVGTVGFDDREVDGLRTYLLKGGFLWVDDFWGSSAWAHWSREIGKVLPPNEFPIIELSSDHPLFRAQFNVAEVRQIPSIQFWRSSGGRTSERGGDSEPVHIRAITDTRGRIMVLMTHNTDISDAWEREGEDAQFFYSFSPHGYALAINVLIYAMTH